MVQRSNSLAVTNQSCIPPWFFLSKPLHFTGTNALFSPFGKCSNAGSVLWKLLNSMLDSERSEWCSREIWRCHSNCYASYSTAPEGVWDRELEWKERRQAPMNARWGLALKWRPPTTIAMMEKWATVILELDHQTNETAHTKLSN